MRRGRGSEQSAVAVVMTSGSSIARIQPDHLCARESVGQS